MEGSGSGRAATAMLAAAAAVAAAATVGAVRAVLHHGERADANSRLDWADREIAWGNGWTLSQDALYAARSLIPPTAEYEVLVGPPERFESQLTEPYASTYVYFFLMPRHQRGGSRWIVCLRCDAPTSQVEFADAENGVSVLRRSAS